MTTGLLDPRTDMLVDMTQPINLLHPLNRKSLMWWLALPGTTGGRRYMDIFRPGPNENHGRLTNPNPVVNWVATDRPGGFWAVDFDGSVDDFVIGGDDRLGIDGATALSGCAWVQLDNLGGDGVIMSKGDFDDFAAILFFRDDVGSVSGRTNIFTIQVGDGTDLAKIEGATGSANDNEWHQVFFTFAALSSTGLHLFIDGVEDPNSPVSTVTVDALASNSDDFRVAKASSGVNKEMNGRMDDIRLWNRTLTPNEVLWYYQLSQQGYPGILNRLPSSGMIAASSVIPPPPPPVDDNLPEYGQRRAAVGDPPVYGATIVRS